MAEVTDQGPGYPLAILTGAIVITAIGLHAIADSINPVIVILGAVLVEVVVVAVVLARWPQDEPTSPTPRRLDNNA